MALGNPGQRKRNRMDDLTGGQPTVNLRFGRLALAGGYGRGDEHVCVTLQCTRINTHNVGECGKSPVGPCTKDEMHPGPSSRTNRRETPLFGLGRTHGLPESSGPPSALGRLLPRRAVPRSVRLHAYRSLCRNRCIH